MNVVRFVYRRLETLLILAVVLLLGQLAWPSIVHWWKLPSPGTVGFDEFFDSDSLAKDFLVSLPVEYRSATWPLVVFLHGSGERGNSPNILRSQAVFHQALPAIVVASQCLPSHTWEPDVIARLVQHVASRYRVDRNRIYLVGYSMGGDGTWKTAAIHPNLFAAIVPICGSGDSDDAKVLAGIPLWAFHGAKDETVPVEDSLQMIEAIRKAGGKPKLTVIPEAGHGICRSVCSRADLWTWLFKQHRAE